MKWAGEVIHKPLPKETTYYGVTGAVGAAGASAAGATSSTAAGAGVSIAAGAGDLKAKYQMAPAATTTKTNARTLFIRFSF